MASKIFASIFASTLTVALLAGCSTEVDDTYSINNDVKIADYPSWNESSVTQLKELGWEINDSLNLPISETENIKFPDIYQAVNPKNECTVTFNSDITNIWNENMTDLFNTQRYLLLEVERNLSPDLQKVKLENANLNIADSENKLGALKAEYSYPKMVFNPEAGEDSLIPQTQEEGTVNAVTIMRAFNTKLPNISAQLSMNADIDLPKESYSVVSVRYACLDEKLDPEIVKIISENSTLDITIKSE